jgi:hypothetical protein
MPHKQKQAKQSSQSCAFRYYEVQISDCPHFSRFSSIQANEGFKFQIRQAKNQKDRQLVIRKFNWRLAKQQLFCKQDSVNMYRQTNRPSSELILIVT